MWRLWNYLFNWQYVWMKYNGQATIRRVTMQPNGELRGKISCWDFFINLEDKSISGQQERSINEWEPLTWKFD